MTVSDLVGTWRLVSFETRGSDGVSNKPLGSDARGVLSYDASGNFSVQVACPGRPNFASGDLLDGADDEIRAAYTGYAAYFGAYDVSEVQGYLTHNVDESLFPNWKGVPQKRFFELSGNSLTLTAPPITISGRVVTGVLVWECAS